MERGGTIQGAPVPWGAALGYRGSLPCTKHGVFWELLCPRMSLKLHLPSPWSLDAPPQPNSARGRVPACLGAISSRTLTAEQGYTVPVTEKNLQKRPSRI